MERIDEATDEAPLNSEITRLCQEVERIRGEEYQATHLLKQQKIKLETLIEEADTLNL